MSRKGNYRAELKMELSNLTELLKDIDGTKAIMAKAYNATAREFKSRGKGWINNAITQYYNITATELNKHFKGAQLVGKTSLGGVPIDDYRLIYKGKRLSLTHFKKSAVDYPKKKIGERVEDKTVTPGDNIRPKKGGPRDYVMLRQTKPYQITVQIKIGNTQRLKGRFPENAPFIASMPKKREPGETTAPLPFQRSSSKRSSAESIRTLSVPSMIENPRLNKSIMKNINEGLENRLQHHIERYSKQSK